MRFAPAAQFETLTGKCGRQRHAYAVFLRSGTHGETLPRERHECSEPRARRRADVMPLGTARADGATVLLVALWEMGRSVRTATSAAADQRGGEGDLVTLRCVAALRRTIKRGFRDVAATAPVRPTTRLRLFRRK